MIKKLEWDSDFFDQNIYELNIDDINNIDTIPPNSFLQIKISECDLESKIILELNKFTLIDSQKEYILKNLELVDAIDENQLTIEYNSNKNQDLMVGAIFVENSRFNIYAEKQRVIEFYNEWVEKSKIGKFDDKYLNYIFKGKNIGFSTLRYLDDSTVRIGLFGVFPDFQGKGYGKIMLLKLISEMKNNSVTKILIATQGKNIIAQKLYESVGFELNVIENIYYKKIGD